MSALTLFFCVKERASGLENLHIFPKFSSGDPAQSGVRMPVRREGIEEKRCCECQQCRVCVFQW